jgi:thioredoxin-related protein
MKKSILILTATVLLGAILNGQSVNFVKGTWAEVKTKASSEKKYLFVDCFTEWCGWCKVLDQKTFSDPTVGEFMNKNFVAVKIDMEKDYGINLAMKYRVNAFPTALVFNPDGKLVSRIMGYSDPDKYIKHLADALDPSKQLHLEGVSDVVDLDFPQFYRDAFAGNGKRSWPAEKVVTDFLDKRSDLFDEVSWDVIKLFNAGEKYDKQVLNNIDRYRKLYGSEVQDKITNIIYAVLNEAIKNKDEGKLNEALAGIEKYLPEEKKELSVSFRLTYYSGIGDWKKLAELYQSDLDVNGYKNAAMINTYSWNIYEKCDDQAVLMKAAGWMKKALETDSQYAYVDTYAALLYKTRQFTEAEVQAKRAIEAGKKSKDDTKETEALLVKIQEALKK